jgi:hypothetical protein
VTAEALGHPAETVTSRAFGGGHTLPGSLPNARALRLDRSGRNPCPSLPENAIADALAELYKREPKLGHSMLDLDERLTRATRVVIAGLEALA